MNKKSKPSTSKRRPRLVPRHGEKFEIIRIGHKSLLFRDFYANLLSLPWPVLIIFIAVFYICSNAFFATIYFVDGTGVENAHSFLDFFFFSVQTMATIGYGVMVPKDIPTNLLVTIEAFWGFAYFAFVTGVVYTKFSRPTSRVLFSDVAVVSNFQGIPHLKIRLANQRLNRIVDAQANVYLLRDMVTKEGYPIRQINDLKLMRDHTPLLSLTWTLFHPIDESSPLFGNTTEDICRLGDEIIVSISGLDETLAQTIYAHHSYVAEEIIFDAFFEDVLTREEGSVRVDYNLFHAVRPEPKKLKT
jgi:inward rectifier potassium channel